MFFCRLALALGRPLADVFEFSAAELEVWRQYQNSYGFPHDRLEWAIAMAAAYVGATMGGKAKPAELVPHVGRRAANKDDIAGVKAWFAARAAKKAGE